MVTKVDRVICAVIAEKILEVFYNDKSIVICLQEPLKLLEVVVKDVFETLLCLVPQPLPPLLDLELDSAQIAVLLSAHEDQLVTVAAPGVLNVDCLQGKQNGTSFPQYLSSSA